MSGFFFFFFFGLASDVNLPDIHHVPERSVQGVDGKWENGRRWKPDVNPDGLFVSTGGFKSSSDEHLRAICPPMDRDHLSDQRDARYTCTRGFVRV